MRKKVIFTSYPIPPTPSKNPIFASWKTSIFAKKTPSPQPSLTPRKSPNQPLPTTVKIFQPSHRYPNHRKHLTNQLPASLFPIPWPPFLRPGRRKLPTRKTVKSGDCLRIGWRIGWRIVAMVHQTYIREHSLSSFTSTFHTHVHMSASKRPKGSKD